MIYYKKKNPIKRIANYINLKFETKKNNSSFFKKSLFFLIALFAIVYSSFIFLTPKLFNEANAEKIINSYILNNTKLILDTSNIVVKPDYKFNINIKSNYINLKYPNKTNFISIINPNIDINVFSLLYGYIDLNKFKASAININTSFTKEKKYDCFKYIDINKKDKSSKFKLRNLNINCKEFSLTIYDENINKNFFIKTKNLKTSSSEYAKPLTITTSGTISSSSNKISDLILNLSIKTNPKSVSNFKTKLAKLNYNPLKDADKYKFYAKTNIDLKINPNDKKNNITGNIDFKDLTFEIKNIILPKNNVSFVFKEGKITSKCNFKLIKNQFLNIALKIAPTKKFIEAKLNSNEINLEDLDELINAICEIFNLKFSSKEISINGDVLINLYVKSNFKTITSNGKLDIKNAKLTHKKTGLTFNEINSNINFENNTIDIQNTSAFINNAKFNLKGTIDTKTNLDLKITSDPINIAQINSLVKDFPFSKNLAPNLEKYSFKKGLLKINSTINGNFSNPKIRTNSTLSDFIIYLKDYDATFSSQKASIIANPEKTTLKEIEIFITNSKAIIKNKISTIPTLKIKILNNDILISKTNVLFEKQPLNIEGIIKNYKTKSIEGNFNITTENIIKNNFLNIDDENINLDSLITFKNNKTIINYCNLNNKTRNIASINGTLLNSDGLNLKDIKINILEKTKFNIPNIKNLIFSTNGYLTINGNMQKPDISGKLTLYDISLKDINLNIQDVLLDIKNSDFYINILKGSIFDFDFNLVAQAKYLNNTLIVDFAQIQSPYINLENFGKYYNNSISKNNFNYKINNLKGSVLNVEFADLMLNSISFEGDIKNDILNIAKFNADILEGKINGNATIDLKNQKTSAQINTKEISIRHLSSNLKNLSIAASGKLSSNLKADFIGFNFEDIIKTLNGKINFTIENGELSQFAKLERFLQAGNILSQSFLKLTLNSTLSAITKQNTGDFKTISGLIDINNSLADILYINTQGTNMSLHIEGKYNLINNYIDTKVLGRIPNSIVNIMGNAGSFSLNQKINNNSMTSIEKMFSTQLSKEELEKIPPLAYSQDTQNTRQFIVFVNGIVNNINSVQNFKWHHEL